jgi:hypothetical protein
MKRSHMVCSRCVKFDGTDCRLDPEAYSIDQPESHWCAQGQWLQWSDRYQEMEPYFWGEWQPEPLLN